jgi:hypothetical protein
MTSTIRTYEDLLAERQRLESLLHTQKQIIREDIDDIKQALVPVKTAINFVGKLTTQDHSNPILNGTINTVIDLVMNKLVLAKSGWLTRFIVPFIMKNFSSHVVDEKKDDILRKVFSLFKKKKKDDKTHESNGKMHHPVEEEEDDDDENDLD